MVMRNGRDSSNAQQNWWDDLPPAIRRRFRNVIQEQLFHEEGLQGAAVPQTTQPPLPPEGNEREFVGDLLRLTGTFLAVILIVLLLMLGCVRFLSSGGYPGSWPF